MKFPDRVKQNVTGSTAALVLGAAVAPYRTLAAAITAGDVAVGDRVSVCVEDAAGNWEESYYSVTSGTQLARESVYRSSGTVTFPATAFCTVFGKDLVVTRDVAFSATVPLTHAGAAYMPQTTVTGPLTFTPAANAVRGALAYLRLVADGTNAPNFSAFKEWGGSLGYDNRNSIVNQVQFFYDGADHWVSVSQAADATAVSGPATVSGVTVSPSTASLSGGGSQTFTATVSGTNFPAQTVTWSASAGSITSGGVFTAPASTASTQTITITATSTVDNTKSGTATVTVAATGTPTPTVTSVSVSPSTANVAGGATQQFTATVTGTNSPSQGVTWSASAGSINASGLFTAPAATGSAQTITITATSTQDATKSGTATVTVAAATPASTYPRLSGLVSMTESGSDPYTYTGTGGSFSNVIGGVLTTSLAAGVDGYVDFKITAANEVIAGLSTTAPLSSWQGWRFGVYAQAGSGATPTSYRRINQGANAANANGIATAAGDILRVSRVGNIMRISVARAATPTTFIDMDSRDYGSSPQLWYQMLCTNTASIQLLASGGFA